MKLLYSAIDVDLNYEHGGSTHILETVKSFSRFGFKVYLIIARKPKNRIKNVIFVSPPFLPKNGVLKNIVYIIFTFFISLSLLLMNRISIVYERARIVCGISILVSRIFRVKSILEQIEPIVEQIKYINTLGVLLKPIFLFVANRSDVVTVTHPTMEHGISKKKIIRVETAVDVDKFNPNVNYNRILKTYKLKKGKIVLYVGSFRKWHALDKILSAAKLIWEIDRDVRFLLVGDGEMLDHCKNKVRKMKIKNVIFTGSIEHDKLPAYINASTVCIALFDPKFKLFKKCDYFFSPIKVQEYKACAKPIVASNMGNLKKIVKHGINGLLVNPEDIDEIVKAIIFLIKNRNVAKNMGRINRKEVVEKYKWDTINKKILKRIF